jgi:hypothetical protein
MRASRTAAPSEASPESYRLEKSEIAQFAVAHAGIYLTNNGKQPNLHATKHCINPRYLELTDHHYAAHDAGYGGLIDPQLFAHRVEDEKMSEDFFGGIQVEESPNQDHVPCINEGGFVDGRTGLEEWPQLWQIDKEVSLKDHDISNNDMGSVCITKEAVDNEDNADGDNGSIKRILKPKSKKHKLSQQFHNDMYTDTAPTFLLARSPIRVPGLLKITKNRTPHSPNVETQRVSKRSARESFLRKSTVNPYDREGEFSESATNSSCTDQPFRIRYQLVFYQTSLCH